MSITRFARGWMILLAVCLAAGLPVHAGTSLADGAAGDAAVFTSGAFEYTVTDGNATITGYRDTGSATLAVPDRLDGHAVVAIGGWAFYGCENFTSATVISNLSIPEYKYANLVKYGVEFLLQRGGYPLTLHRLTPCNSRRCFLN